MKKLAFILGIVLTAPPAQAWNSTGHKAIALIAYQNLTPATKQRVDALLARHPDHSRWVQGVVAQDRGRVAFMNASIWADAIRSDPRFHDDNRRATPRIPGLPEGAQSRHADWHFINTPFSPDGTAMPPGAGQPNVLTKLKEFENLGTMPEAMQVYVLPWLLHLAQDVHQPLHVLARFTKDYRNGDRGGNLVETSTSQNLHSYWDSRIGTGETDRFLRELALTIQRRHPQRQELSLNPTLWVNESYELRTQVYGFSGAGTKQNPAVLSDQYSVDARKTAFERAALAGCRLAQFLTERLP